MAKRPIGKALRCSDWDEGREQGLRRKVRLAGGLVPGMSACKQSQAGCLEGHSFIGACLLRQTCCIRGSSQRGSMLQTRGVCVHFACPDIDVEPKKGVGSFSGVLFLCFHANPKSRLQHGSLPPRKYSRRPRGRRWRSHLRHPPRSRRNRICVPDWEVGHFQEEHLPNAVCVSSVGGRELACWGCFKPGPFASKKSWASSGCSPDLEVLCH